MRMMNGISMKSRRKSMKKPSINVRTGTGKRMRLALSLILVMSVVLVSAVPV